MKIVALTLFSIALTISQGALACEVPVCEDVLGFDMAAEIGGAFHGISLSLADRVARDVNTSYFFCFRTTKDTQEKFLETLLVAADIKKNEKESERKKEWQKAVKVLESCDG